MSKLSFRARALDATKPLPIYHAVDLPDISEYNTINRTVPQMPTGMEKEEETERHLQDVIIAQQTNRTNKNVIIPTPENAIVVGEYDEVTPRMDRAPPIYIRVPGLPLEEDLPDYDLDSEDEEWLSRQTMEKPLSCLQFERMMDKLEKGSGNVVLSEREAQALLKDDDELVLAVYEYWLSKRLNLGRPLLPTVKQERRDGTASGNNPYIAFRKRTEKMQTRKNRKNDETAYMQMQKLKRDLDKAFSLTALIKERANKKYDLAHVQMDIFTKRYMLQDWSGSILSSMCPVATRSATTRQNSNVNECTWDGNSILKVEADEDYDIHQVGRHEVLVSGIKKKRRKKYYTSHLTESPIPDVPSTPERASTDALRVPEFGVDKIQEEDEVDSKYSFKRRTCVKYHMARDSIRSWPWLESPGRGVDDEEEEEGGVEFGCITTRERPSRPKKLRYSNLTLSGEYIGLSRKRVGRGGRIVFDRVPLSEMEDLDNTLPDSDIMDTSASLGTPLPAASFASLEHSVAVQPLSLPTPSPVAASSAAHFPGVGVVSPAADAMRTSPLARLPPVLGAVPPAAVGGGGGGENLQEGSSDRKRRLFKSLHFKTKVPSPSSKAETPPPLDFIVPHPLSFPDASPYSPDGLGFHSPDAYASSEFSVLRRLPSFSDYREEMTTFSSLPTSHFTLRPSSSDKPDESPMSYWNQSGSGSGDRYSESYSWSWNHPFTGIGNEKHLHRSSISGNGNNIRNNSTSSLYQPHLFSAPPNYGSNYRPGTAPRQKANQQVQNDNNASNTSVKDVSRSSLSVTNSKTIVLTNTPASSQHSASTGDKKKAAENKGLQNHKLIGMSGGQKKWSAPVTERQSKKQLQDGTNPVASAGGGGGGGASRTKSVDELKATASSGGESSDIGGGGGGQVNGMEGNEELSKTKEKATVEGVKAAVVGANAVKETTPGGDERRGESGGGVGGDTAGTGSGRSSVPPAPATLAKPIKEKSSSVVRRSPPKDPVDVDIWSVNGPGSRILSLNSSTLKEKTHPKRLLKKHICVLANVESAKAITSKFGVKVTSKKSESGSLGPSSVGDLTMASLSAQAQGPPGLLLHTPSSASSRSGSSTPTILNSLDGVLAQQKLGALGTAMAASLSGVKVTELPSTKSSETTLSSTNSSIGGADMKRTSTNSVPDGIVGHVTSQVDHVTSSVGTNGTNFQDMFNTSKRKLSESTERGLKQALAGFMKHKLVNVKLPDCKVE